MKYLIACLLCLVGCSTPHHDWAYQDYDARDQIPGLYSSSDPLAKDTEKTLSASFMSHVMLGATTPRRKSNVVTIERVYASPWSEVWSIH